MKTAAAVLLALALSGCVLHHSGADTRRLVPENGVTTRRDAVSVLGNPDRVRGGEWHWRHVRTLGGKFKAGYMAVGFTLANSAAASEELRLVFDGRGVLKSWSVDRSLPSDTGWSVNPFSD